MAKYSTEEFIEMYKKNPEEALKTITKRKYVPLMEKSIVAQDAVTRYNLLDGEVNCNTPMTYLCYVVSVLRLYTYLDIKTQNTDEDYDLLAQEGLIEILLKNIGSDLKEFQTIFDMCKDDFRVNYMSNQGIIQRYIKKLKKYIETKREQIAQWFSSEEGQEIFAELTEKLSETLDKKGE